MGMTRQFSEAAKGRLSSVENRLADLLKPIAPRKEFVHGLSHRLQTGSQTTFVSRLTDWHFYAMLAAGFISFLILLAVGMRAFSALLRKRRPV